MALALIALIIVAVLIAAVSLSAGRPLLPGKGGPPPVLPTQAQTQVQQPPLRAAPPPATPRTVFRKRPRSAHFNKRAPTAPPKSKELGRKPKGDGGTLKGKRLHLDFNLPCTVTGRARLECGCQICRDLRKRFGV